MAAKAELMGVSIPTARRMLRGEVVDRATVCDAFALLGIECESRVVQSPAPATPVEPPVVPSAAEHPVPPARSVARVRTWQSAFVSAALLALVAIVVSGLLSYPGQVEQRDRRDAFDDCLAKAVAAYHRCDYAAAEAEAARLLPAARKIDSAARIADVMRLQADLALVRGDLDAARSALLEAKRLRSLLAHDASLPNIVESLGVVELRAGRPREAEAYFRTALAALAKSEDETGVVSARRRLGSALHRQGDFVGARAELVGALSLARRLRKPEMVFAIEGQIALLDRDEGHFDKARAALARCLEHWQAAGHRRWIAKVRFELATVEASAGNGPAARELFRLSREGFDASGDRHGANRCDAEIARLDGSPVPATFNTAGQLEASRVASN
jgi:tetratricopeptide (TPR) repeat protein